MTKAEHQIRKYSEVLISTHHFPWDPQFDNTPRGNPASESPSSSNLDHGIPSSIRLFLPSLDRPVKFSMRDILRYMS